MSLLLHPSSQLLGNRAPFSGQRNVPLPLGSKGGLAGRWQPETSRLRATDTKPEVEVGKRQTDSREQEHLRKEAFSFVQDLPAEQQKLFMDGYMFLVQHPDSSLRISNLSGLQRLFNQYQVLLWRPAELLNGRMAMLGFFAGVGCELLTGASVWRQLNYAPFAYFFAYALVVAAAALNQQFGAPTKGVGPFTREAELLNGRAAMIGYSLIAIIEYNQDIKRSALLWAAQLQRLQG